jgi:serine/threonine protein kinase
LPPHRNVVSAVGVCRAPPALLTEYCALGSLDRLVQLRRFSLRRLLVVLMDAAAGVHHLHTHGVIHCDLAARNLLMHASSVVKGLSIEL